MTFSIEWNIDVADSWDLRNIVNEMVADSSLQKIPLRKIIEMFFFRNVICEHP